MDEKIEDYHEVDSKTLASFIVAYRYLNINKDRAKKCMQVLLYREESGDDFNYEEYISEQIKSMPDLSQLKNSRKNSNNIVNILNSNILGNSTLDE